MGETVPESVPKRKTLAERAGEPISPLRSLSQMPQPSKPTVTRSDSTRAMVNGSYRNISNASTSSSTSSGMRPPSRQNGGQPWQFGGRPPSAMDARTTLEDTEEAEAGVMGKRKGTPILSFQTVRNGITLRKTRTVDNLRLTNEQAEADMSTRSQHSGSYIRAISSSSSSTTASDDTSESSERHRS